MQWAFIITGLVLGAVSSFHCVGMCGAIALSLPVNKVTGLRRTLSIILYNLGRIITYSLLGLAFGLAGRGLYIGGLQKWFSIIAGMLLLLFAISNLLHSGLVRVSFLQKNIYRLQAFIAKMMARQSFLSVFFVGIANGLLPCGMVYFAVTGAVAAGNVMDAVFFMAAFGLGTLPLMMAVSYFGFIISLTLRNNIKSLIPYFMIAMAVMLVMRGVTYTSAAAGNTDIIPCHTSFP